ncbi:MAG: hypothetical protein PHR21_03765 [Oscillospiraceae bacterium]|nr:hypothetical protein [Oscillospiraceae bacterium]MDD4367863.1 hypothetical protein [Oscillospiraceae bacterium]
MTTPQIIILSQEGCPRCAALRQYLSLGPRQALARQAVVWVEREADPAAFTRLAQSRGIQSTPAVIWGSQLLRQPTLSQLNQLLDQYQQA